VKYILTLLAGYYLPAIGNHINIDVCLGIVAGLLFGALMAFLFIGPTPAPRHDTAKATVRKPTQRKIIESTQPKGGYVFVPINYPQGAMA